MYFISILNKIDNFLNKIEKLLIFIFGLTLTLIMISQVILRYFFNSPIFWAEEIAVQFLIFITAFGISCLAKAKGLISVDFLRIAIGDKYGSLLKIINDFLFLILVAFLLYYSWDWVLRADTQMEMSGTTGLPKWYSYAAFPIAFSLLCFHQVVIFINNFFSINEEGIV